MKKLHALLLILFLLLSLCSCTGNAPHESVSSALSPESYAAVPEPTPKSSTEPVPPDPAQSPEPTQSVGPTMEELRDSVPILINEGLEYESVPEDMAGIIYSSAWKWMLYTFTDIEMNGEQAPPLEDYSCTSLELFDVSEDEKVFCYSIKCEFKPQNEEGYLFWQPSNTVEAEREGWWRLSRQIAVGRDGEAWEIISVGTGAVTVEGHYQEWLSAHPAA